MLRFLLLLSSFFNVKSDAECDRPAVATGQNLLQQPGVHLQPADHTDGPNDYTKFYNFTVSTTGGRLRAVQSSSSRCTGISYSASSLEKRFKEKPLQLTKDKATLCDALGGWSNRWIGQNMEDQAAPDPEIFSRICPGHGNEQIIEPLAGVLRDPRMFCPDSTRETMMSVDWLVLADNHSFPSQHGRRIFFDAGGTVFRDATQFFVTKYAERGIEFDEIYVWEASKRTASSYWEGVPQEVRAKWEPKLTWYNGIPVTAERQKHHNPVHRIHQLCKPEDFCAFKLDIDSPSVENPLALQLLADPGNLKEFFFEQHVNNEMMADVVWKIQSQRSGTFADSYSLFSGLREKGVRAHSWI